jgi:hypothetical protein
VSEPAAAGAGPEPGTSGLGLLLRQYREDGRQIAVLSVQAIAAIVRRALPEAATVRLAWNHAGRLRPLGFHNADLEPIGLEGSEGEGWTQAGTPDFCELLGQVTQRIEGLCASLGEENEDAWLPYARSSTADGAALDGEYDLSVSAALPARPRPRARL